MDRTKLMVFYWFLGSISFGLFCILSPDVMKPPPSPIQVLHPKVEELLLAIFVPVLPIAVGIGLWQGKVRSREREQEIQAMGRPASEARLQACLDDLAHALLEGQRETALRLCMKQAEALLEADGRLRWSRFYLMSIGPGSLPAEPVRPQHREVSLVNVRLQIRIIALLAVLFFIMTPFVFFAFSLLRAFLPPIFQLGPDGAMFEAKQCLELGVTAIVGTLGLRALLRRDQRWKASLDAHEERGREILLESCRKRLDWLLQKGILHAPSDSPICRMARASVVDALALLDDARKERLFLDIQERGLSEVINLSSAGLPKVPLMSGSEARA